MRFTLHRLVKKTIVRANTVGTVIRDRYNLTPLHLIVMTMPIQKAVTSETEIMNFTEKRHVQIANNPRSPQLRTEAELLN
jgi:hypothetical protein